MHEINWTMEVVKCFEIIKVDIKHLLHDFVYFDKFMHMDDRLSYNIGKLWIVSILIFLNESVLCSITLNNLGIWMMYIVCYSILSILIIMTIFFCKSQIDFSHYNYVFGFF